MDENMIQYIYGNTNAKVSHNRIRWNIKATTTTPTSQTEGHLGDVLIVTSADVKKLKYVATKKAGEELQDNSINIYEDFLAEKILANSNNGFNMYIFGTSQNILLNGESLIANVYIYDALTNDWVQLSSAYVDAINLDLFTGQTLALTIDNIWNGPSCVDSVNENEMLPTMIKPQVNDVVLTTDFSGKELDVDTLWNGIAFTDSAVLRTSNTSEGDDIIVN